LKSDINKRTRVTSKLIGHSSGPHPGARYYKKVVLDVILTMPIYSVLTAIWLQYGGTIKQLNDINKKEVKAEFKKWDKGGCIGNFWEKYGRHPLSAVVRLSESNVHYDEWVSGELAKDKDFPFQLWRYRLKEYEKIASITQNIYPFLVNEHIKNSLYKQELIKISNSLMVSNSDINLKNQWFAGVFDACGLIIGDEAFFGIILCHVNKELLQRIRDKFWSIGYIDDSYKYNKDGIIEQRATWVVTKHNDAIRFSKYILQEYKLVSGKEHKLKLVEKYCSIASLEFTYKSKGKYLTWRKMMRKFLDEEWNKYTYL
jgi:hypothetical protein